MSDAFAFTYGNQSHVPHRRSPLAAARDPAGDDVRGKSPSGHHATPRPAGDCGRLGPAAAGSALRYAGHRRGIILDLSAPGRGLAVLAQLVARLVDLATC